MESIRTLFFSRHFLTKALPTMTDPLPTGAVSQSMNREAIQQVRHGYGRRGSADNLYAAFCAGISCFRKALTAIGICVHSDRIVITTT